MAEELTENGCGSVVADETPNEVKVCLVTPTTKRCSTASPNSAPPYKSPRTDDQSPTTQTPDAGEDQLEKEKPETQTGNADRPESPVGRRKSWRRATLTRRSLPAHPNPYQALCRNISTSLSQQERLEKLLEASMKLAIERTQNSLQSVPNISLESFQKQVEHIKTQWGCLTKNVDNEPQLLLSSASEPAVQKAMENVQRAISRIQAESESWEELLNKHRSKAEELERQVEKGQQTGIPLNSSTMEQSSQYRVIQSKPNYHSLLCRQQPVLHTMETIMDTQRKMIRELISIKEQSQLLMKVTSGRLAEKAGIQDLSSDVLRNLMSSPLSTTTS
ncbi:kinetochore-associated protein DSN1 homolog [Melanotaenia boesemani]|uniref:kinetochore-associated protein DSN1 homolog n=1 Tax=Melanotaenia boesemani TaxID=1250792 RepID=UPI001C04B7C8|nr:kinetochore-associated protein DSN1 homolog [Melanotaenia boesemani]